MPFGPFLADGPAVAGPGSRVRARRIGLLSTLLQRPSDRDFRLGPRLKVPALKSLPRSGKFEETGEGSVGGLTVSIPSVSASMGSPMRCIR